MLSRLELCIGGEGALDVTARRRIRDGGGETRPGVQRVNSAVLTRSVRVNNTFFHVIAIHSAAEPGRPLRMREYPYKRI